VAGKKRKGLFSFGQGRGMIKRGTREVVSGSLWQLLCQVKRKTLLVLGIVIKPDPGVDPVKEPGLGF
jgi:hypothetical protein